MSFRTTASRIIVAVPLCVVLAASVNGQTLSQEEFSRRVDSVYQRGDEEGLRQLVSENRLLVKPLVHDLIRKGLRDGHFSEHRNFEEATALAAVFESQFGEKSLSEAASYPAGWSLDERRHKLAADSLYELGTAERGDAATRDAAMDRYTEALRIYREIGDRLGEATTLGGIAVVHWYRREPELVIERLEEALEARIRVDDRELIANTWNDLGNAYYLFFGEYSKALEHHVQAERIRREMGDLVNQGRSLGYMAMVYEALGEYESALEHHDRAIAVFTEAGDEDRAAAALHNEGYLLTNLGRYSDALSRLERARRIKERIGGDQLSTLNQIGIVYRKLGDLESALESYQEVLRLAEESGDSTLLGQTLSNAGVVLLYAERTQAAMSYFNRALALHEKLGDDQGRLDALVNLGSSHSDLREPEKAREYLVQALELSRSLQDRANEARVQILLGNVNNMSEKSDAAESAYHGAMQIAEDLSNPELTWAALMGFGELYERKDEFEKGIEYYAEAIELAEGIRGILRTEEEKSGFLALMKSPYEAVIHLLTVLHERDPLRGHDRTAFEFAERAKARAFLDLLAESVAEVQAEVDPALLERQSAILDAVGAAQQEVQAAALEPNPDRAHIDELQARIDSLEGEYRTLQREIRSENPAFSDLTYPEPSSLQEVQSSLIEPDLALLEYAIGDSSSTLWTVTREGSHLFRLPPRAEVKEQIEIVRYALSNPETSEPELFASAARKLYEMLIEPAEALVEGKQLVIVPDGSLYYLPFEVLLTEDVGETEQDFAEMPYLIRRHAVSYGQSASVLRRLVEDRTRPETERQLLAFGDPDFGSNDSDSAVESTAEPVSDMRAGLERLPHSGEEVRAIAELFAGEPVDVLVRDEATEERVKSGDLGEYRYIHFATHGLIDERKPDFSSVVLALDRDPNEDGFLQAGEIFNLKMNPELVVLSACETGLGRMIKGEGMVGLTRAFMYAGAPSLVVSLWRVADHSTSEFMQHFYERLIDGKEDKARALQAAKLRVLDDGTFTHPFHWAPFIMIGDWN